MVPLYIMKLKYCINYQAFEVFLKVLFNTYMTVCTQLTLDFLHLSTHEIPTILCTISLKKAALLGRASLCGPRVVPIEGASRWV